MNRKRKSSSKSFSKQNSQQKRSKNNQVDRDPDNNAPFVDDINDLFEMGFVSIEEVDYFDPKRYAQEQESLAATGKDNFNFSKHEDSALKSGWTVSTVKNESEENEKKETLAENGKKAKEEKPGKLEKPKPKPGKQEARTKKKEKAVEVIVPAPEINETDLPNWRRFNLELPILQGLKQAGFTSPLPIQAAALDSLLIQGKKDILGSAPTGSGKTLAFGLPLLNNILKTKGSASNPGASGLIVVPTRELAVQIEKHLKNIARFSQIRIATIVGGLSQEKQNRQLHGKPDLIIATPGRLNELMEFDQEIRGLVIKVKFLILDEADRMIQVGHFKELDDILSRILKHQNTERQVLLFSATLVESRDKDSPFSRLCKKLNLERSAKDLARLNFAGKPVNLQESFALCASQEDKEAVLLGFLKELKKENGLFGRVLLFANSIDTIRRIAHLMALLNVPTISLHAQMQQRQRLNNLDRFKETNECLLIASDVAARGIDIIGVDHVIHFHLPKSKETYVHRCGRTARANLSGTSLALVAPEERKLADSCALNSTRPDVIQYTPNPRETRDFIIPILKLARRIEKSEHSARSAKSEINWATKLAEECELVLDEDNDPSYKKRQEQAAQNPKALAKEIEVSKGKLTQLLDKFYQ
jgi:superfamily II DNA/RNA helicase